MFVGIFKSDPKFDTSLTLHDYHVQLLSFLHNTSLKQNWNSAWCIRSCVNISLHSSLLCSQICYHVQHVTLLSTGMIKWQLTLDQAYTARSICLDMGTIWRVLKLSVQQTVHLYGKLIPSLLWIEQFHHETKYAVCCGRWKCSVNHMKCRNRPTSLYI